MISAKDLDMDFRPKIRYADGTDINLKVVQNALTEEANKHGIPIAFYADQVRVGGVMGIGSKVEDCIVLHHPDHKKDYFTFVIRVAHQGTYAFVSVDGYGKSKLMRAEEGRNRMTANAGANFKAAVFGDGNSVNMTNALIGGAIGGARKLVGALTGAKAKIEQESNWYAMVSDLFEVILDN